MITQLNYTLTINCLILKICLIILNGNSLVLFQPGSKTPRTDRDRCFGSDDGSWCSSGLLSQHSTFIVSPPEQTINFFANLPEIKPDHLRYFGYLHINPLHFTFIAFSYYKIIKFGANLNLAVL